VIAERAGFSSARRMSAAFAHLYRRPPSASHATYGSRTKARNGKTRRRRRTLWGQRLRKLSEAVCHSGKTNLCHH
jgi:AraC-like DNA-binding protein